MANDCFTDINIYFSSVEKAKKFHYQLLNWTSYAWNPEVSKDLFWYGNILGNSGLGQYVEGKGFIYNDAQVNTRGIVMHIERTDNILQMFTDTAWQPQLKMWTILLEKFDPKAHIEYSAEEPGCEMFVTNMSNLLNRYYIDIYEPKYNAVGESIFDASEDYTIKFLQSVLKTDGDDIDELLEQAEDEDWFSVHKWEYSPVEEWF